MKCKYPYLFVVFVLIFSSAITAQKKSRREVLEARRVQLQKDKVWINALLSNTQRKEKDLLVDLKDLNTKIKTRKELIDAITGETKELSNEIYLNQLEINKNKRNLAALKKDYGEMIFKSYKSKSQNSRIMFLLSSQNFFQAYKRFQYMKQYTKFRKNQGVEIQTKTIEIEVLNDSLIVKKGKKEDLLKLQKEEQLSIQSEQEEQKGLLSQVQKRESKYKRQIRQFIRDEEKINAQIDKLIRDAIAASNKKTNPTGSAKKSTKTASFALTPEAKVLADKFTSNKGKLPWPVEKGFVSMYYGKQPHSVVKSLTIQSNGVRITTNKGSKARSVFDGTVLAILVSTGNKRAVLVQHGNYITAYKNLEKLYVEKGDKVKTNEELGTIFTDKITGKTILEFMLSKNTKTENPKSWIYRM